MSDSLYDILKTAKRQDSGTFPAKQYTKERIENALIGKVPNFVQG